LALLDKPPPKGFARWTGPLLAEELCDIDVQYLWRFLRNQKIDLKARKSWCESNDRILPPRQPMSSASISTRPARPSCSASVRSPRSRPWSGRKALDVATGKVLGEHKKRRRRPTVTDRLNRDLRLMLGERLDVIGSRFFLRLRLAERQRRRADSAFAVTPGPTVVRKSQSLHTLSINIRGVSRVREGGPSMRLRNYQPHPRSSLRLIPPRHLPLRARAVSR
jgi:hypothetical protein